MAVLFVPWSSPRKVPCQSSKSGLADPREGGLVCACVEGSVETQGQGSSEQIVSPCPLDGFLGPLLSLFPQAHHRGLGRWGRCAEVRYPSVYKGAWGWVRGSFPSLTELPEHRQKSQERQSPVEGHRGLE